MLTGAEDADLTEAVKKYINTALLIIDEVGFEPMTRQEAILDRPLHNSHVLNVKGRSYRLRDLERAVAQQG